MPASPPGAPRPQGSITMPLGMGVIVDSRRPEDLRPFMVVPVEPGSGKVRAFYMSTGTGTPGQVHRGEWTLFFGIGLNRGTWVIKAGQRGDNKTARPAEREALALAFGGNARRVSRKILRRGGRCYDVRDLGSTTELNQYLIQLGAIPADLAKEERQREFHSCGFYPRIGIEIDRPMNPRET